jgi:hypothetical protein
MITDFGSRNLTTRESGKRKLSMRIYKRVVASSFFILAALLVCQTLIQIRYGEPYPAVWAPGFPPSATDREGKVNMETAQIIVHFSPSESRMLSPGALMFDVTSAHARELINCFAIFAAQPYLLDRPVPRSMLERMAAPSFRAPRSDEAARRRLRGWLKSRLNILLPGRIVQSVDFHWIQLRFDSTLPNMAPSVTTQRIDEISFHSGS